MAHISEQLKSLDQPSIDHLEGLKRALEQEFGTERARSGRFEGHFAATMGQKAPIERPDRSLLAQLNVGQPFFHNFQSLISQLQGQNRPFEPRESRFLPAERLIQRPNHRFAGANAPIRARKQAPAGLGARADPK